ncbi:MAG: LURP-one-related family protein [Propionicimonas sp.]
MLGRGRREERREERATFGLRDDAERYQMREKLLSIGDDFWIQNESGQRAFKVDGKALRLRKTLIIQDPSGSALLRIQDRPIRVREVMEIEDAAGATVATVAKAMITPLRDRFTVTLAGGGQLTAQGNILDHEYTIEAGGTKVAEVSRKWFRIRDSYGVEVAPGQNAVLMLAIAVCIDQMTTR